MKKTMTKSEIKREANKLKREMGKMSDRLDSLMDEAEISAQSMTEKEIQNGKADELNRIAGILRSANEGVIDAMGDMQSI